MTSKLWTPYKLAAYDNQVNSVRRRFVQVVSHPIPATMDKVSETIMVRLVPGIAETIREVPTAKLAATLQYRFCHVAEVVTEEGYDFPADMLRYDDAALYDADIPEAYLRRSEPVLVYRLSSYKAPRWTMERWATFSSSLKPVKTYDLRLSPRS